MDTIAKRSRLAFPAGVAPGFDPYHVANRIKGAIYIGSFIASPGPTFINLPYPIAGTKLGSPTFSNTEIGPTFSSNASNNGTSFTTQWGTVTPAAVTMAAIIIPIASVASGDEFIATGYSGSGRNAIILNSLVFTGRVGSADLSSGLPALNLNEPYFIAASQGPATFCHFVVRSLKSGKVFSNLVANASAVQPFQSPWYIGGTFDGNVAAGIKMAAAMAANSFTDVAALLQWAEDPWAYWYPQPEESWVGVIAGPTDILMPMICM